MSKYICKICKKDFKQLHRLKRHQNNKTSCTYGPKIYQCEYCDNILSSNSNLHHHYKTCKKKDKTNPFQCEFCDKTYLNKSNLQRHLTTCTSKKIMNHLEKIMENKTTCTSKKIMEQLVKMMENKAPLQIINNDQQH